MSLFKYVILMTLSTIICITAFIMVLLFINPETSGFIGYLCFYISLFFSLLGSFSLVLLIIRLFIKKQELPYKHLGISLRQSLWFSILIVVTLILLGTNMFTWWTAGLLLSALFLLEGFFLIQSIKWQQYKRAGNTK